MSGVAVAIGGAAVIGGAVGMYSAKKSAEAQEKAAGEARGTQLEMYYQSRKDQAPWREAGERAVGRLEPMIEAGPGAFEESPGYQFRLKEGEKAINRLMASRGKYFSGQAGKALTRYGQGYAMQEYDNFLRRYYDRLKPYQSLAGVGQTSATETGRLGLMTGQGVAGNILAGGQARASGYTNMANVLSGAVTSGAENYMLSQYLKRNQPGANYMQSVGTNYPSSWQGSAGAAF